MKQDAHSPTDFGFLNRMRDFYDSGATRPYAFRRNHLNALKEAVISNEQAIEAALFADLKKGREEVYATETGLLLAEINVALKKLRQWMRPKHIGTNFVNLPSSSKIYRDPLGVVLIISPWNYPFQLALIPLVGAIAGGNTALIKPSELAPATSAIIEKIIRDIYPPEYISVVQGDGAAIVPGLMRSFRFDHIFYTGSIPVGKAIYQAAAADLIPVTLELGGKSPAIVERDADLAVAARRIAVGKFANAGQTCVAPDYILVQQSIEQLLMEELKKTIINFFGSNPIESKSYGRIINVNRFNKLMSYLSEAEIAFGGQHDKEQLFIAPTIIRNVSLQHAVMKEEIFGPILPVIPFQTNEEALSIIRRNPNPLSFYLFTADPLKEQYWLNSVSFGGGCINNAGWQFANHHMPFGGIGASGIGAYHGKYSFDQFTHAKPVMKTPTWIDPRIKYPPFTGKLKWFKRFIH